MILLTSTSDLIQLVTSSAASIQVHADWIDNNAGVETPGRTNTAIAAAATNTIVGSPASGVQRSVKEVTVFNNDGALTCTVTVRHTDGSTPASLSSVVLLPGESLQKVGDFTWTVLTSTGLVKQAFSFPVLAAGTVSLPSLRMVSGTNETSPVGGDFEYDGVVGYETPVNNERGVLLSEQFLSLTGTFTLTSQTAAQKMFNVPSNGQVTVGGNRSYEFECDFSLSSMSGTSGSFGFAFGGTATFTSLAWWSLAQKGTATLATPTAGQITFNTTAANTALTTASTNTVGYANIRGILRVNAGGTIIPQVSLGSAAAAVVGANSRFRMWPIGAGAVASVGNWS